MPSLRQALRRTANPAKAKFFKGYFKADSWQPGQGDEFLGVTTPELRRIAREGHTLDLASVAALLASRIHEERALALVILVRQFQRAAPAGRGRFVQFYLRQRRRVNHWDLVDSSAPHILGSHLADNAALHGDAGSRLLERLARSRSLWDRRIAIVSTLAFIRRNRFEPTLRIAELLLADREDLIHKAAGWMLREVGKRDLNEAARFLQRHLDRMPRTTLRYAIERFPESRRQAYLTGRIATRP